MNTKIRHLHIVLIRDWMNERWGRGWERGGGRTGGRRGGGGGGGGRAILKRCLDASPLGISYNIWEKLQFMKTIPPGKIFRFLHFSKL